MIRYVGQGGGVLVDTSDYLVAMAMGALWVCLAIFKHLKDIEECARNCRMPCGTCELRLCIPEIHI